MYLVCWCAVQYTAEALDQPTVLYVLYSTVSAQQTKHLPENASQTMPCLPKSIGPPRNS